MVRCYLSSRSTRSTTQTEGENRYERREYRAGAQTQANVAGSVHESERHSSYGHADHARHGSDERVGGIWLRQELVIEALNLRDLLGSQPLEPRREQDRNRAGARVAPYRTE